MEWLSQFVDHPWLFVATSCLALLCLWPFWRWFFGDIYGFSEDVSDASTSDTINFIRGRYWEGEWASLKLAAFAALSFGAVASFYKLATVILF